MCNILFVASPRFLAMSLVWLAALIPQNINNFKRDTMKANKLEDGKFYLQIYAQFALVTDLVEKTWNNNSCWMYLFQCSCLSIAAVNVTSATAFTFNCVQWREQGERGTHPLASVAFFSIVTGSHFMVAAARKIGWFTPVFFLRENNPVTLDRAQVTAGVAACPSCRHRWWTRRTA